MNRISRIILISLSIITIFSCDKSPTSSNPVVVTFTDANFEALIREAISKPTGDILEADLSAVTKLEGDDRDISNITGINYCTNIEEISLRNNEIVDISLLSTLTKLVRLDLSFNDITEIQVLANLTNLEDLGMAGNEIVDINSLSGLNKLQAVFLSFNKIIDISPLVNNSGIDNGDFVSLTSNPLSDISINTYIPQLEARGVTVSNLGKF